MSTALERAWKQKQLATASKKPKDEAEPNAEAEPEVGYWTADDLWACRCMPNLGPKLHWPTEAECPDCGYKRPPVAGDVETASIAGDIASAAMTDFAASVVKDCLTRQEIYDIVDSYIAGTCTAKQAEVKLRQLRDGYANKSQVDIEASL